MVPTFKYFSGKDVPSASGWEIALSALSFRFIVGGFESCSFSPLPDALILYDRDPDLPLTKRTCELERRGDDLFLPSSSVVLECRPLKGEKEQILDRNIVLFNGRFYGMLITGTEGSEYPSLVDGLVLRYMSKEGIRVASSGCFSCLLDRSCKELISIDVGRPLSVDRKLSELTRRAAEDACRQWTSLLREKGLSCSLPEVVPLIGCLDLPDVKGEMGTEERLFFSSARPRSIELYHSCQREEAFEVLIEACRDFGFLISSAGKIRVGMGFQVSMEPRESGAATLFSRSPFTLESPSVHLIEMKCPFRRLLCSLSQFCMLKGPAVSAIAEGRTGGLLRIVSVCDLFSRRELSSLLERRLAQFSIEFVRLSEGTWRLPQKGVTVEMSSDEERTSTVLDDMISVCGGVLSVRLWHECDRLFGKPVMEIDYRMVEVLGHRKLEEKLKRAAEDGLNSNERLSALAESLLCDVEMVLFASLSSEIARLEGDGLLLSVKGDRDRFLLRCCQNTVRRKAVGILTFKGTGDERGRSEDTRSRLRLTEDRTFRVWTGLPDLSRPCRLGERASRIGFRARFVRSWK